jgi:hypothetical protein
VNERVIFKTAAGWFCRYEGPHADEVVRLFGTATLPLPWTAAASAETVLSAVQAQVKKNWEVCEVVYELNAPLSWTSVPGEVA